MERIIDMSLSGCNCGVAITGSFCTFDKVKIEIEEMTKAWNIGISDLFPNGLQRTIPDLAEGMIL